MLLSPHVLTLNADAMTNIGKVAPKIEKTAAFIAFRLPSRSLASSFEPPNFDSSEFMICSNIMGAMMAEEKAVQID